MKKTFLALSLMVAAATIASGASIKWAIGGTIDASADIDTSVGSFILAYVGNTGGTGVDAATFNTEMAKGTESAYTVADTGNWSDFYSSARQTYAATKTKEVADVADATYQIFYVNDGKYSLVNDPTIVTMAISIDPTTGGASTSAYVNGTSTGTSTMYAAGGQRTAITSVPEPSVALMGLLGLGMLLKRRRA